MDQRQLPGAYVPVMGAEEVNRFLREVFPQACGGDPQEYRATDVRPGGCTVLLDAGFKHLRPGNTVSGPFETQFTVRAAYRHLRGGEAVIASRLENRHPVIITVRASSQTKQITADWQLVDARDGTAWAVRDVTHETDRQFISLLCERGVAA